MFSPVRSGTPVCVPVRVMGEVSWVREERKVIR